MSNEHRDMLFILVALLVSVGLPVGIAIGVEKHKSHAAIGPSIAAWAKATNRDVDTDKTSCRFDAPLIEWSADCDLRMKDGTRVLVRCNETGCATRSEQ